MSATYLEKRKISELSPHPQNSIIYGHSESIDDLVQGIKSTGYISPFVITQNNVIVSGHRRQRACLELGVEEVEVIVREFDSETDVLEAIVLENKVREKTKLQKSNEAEILMEVEKIRAKKRQATSTGGANPQLVAIPPQAEHRGKSRDIVAEQVGLKSGREVEKCLVATKAIGEAIAVGDTDKAEIIAGQLERAPSTAERLVHNWESVDKEELEEYKDDLKSGKMSANSFIGRNPKKSRKTHEQAERDAVIEESTKHLQRKRALTSYQEALEALGVLKFHIEVDSESLFKHTDRITSEEEIDDLCNELDVITESISQIKIKIKGRK